MALRSLKPLVTRRPVTAVKFPEKKVDEFYHSQEWARTRKTVLKRDGFQCVAVIDGFRCTRAATIVDHIKRRRDGGTEEMSNLRSLCRDCDNRMKEKWDGTRRGG